MISLSTFVGEMAMFGTECIAASVRLSEFFLFVNLSAISMLKILQYIQRYRKNLLITRILFQNMFNFALQHVIDFVNFSSKFAKTH